MLEWFRPASSTHNSDDAADMPTSSANAVKVSALTTGERFMLRVPEGYIITLAGGLAGAASGVVSCPLDVIKTKLQAQGGFRARKNAEGPGRNPETYRGVKGTAKTIWREEGLRGMYRGLGPMLLGYVPTWAVYLTVYNQSQAYFFTKTDNKFLANMYASLAGGTCSTLVTNPIWVIKTRLMSQSSSRSSGNQPRPPWHYRSTIDAARKMYMHEGLLSFYSGLTPALLGLTHVAVQFPLYEIFKVKFTGVGLEGTHTEEDGKSHFWGLSLAVFLSKVIASTATYPHEVVRTRLQTQQRSQPHHSPENLSYRGGEVHTGHHGRPMMAASSDGMINLPRYRGTIQTCKTIMLEEGWRGFYAGLGTNLIRAVPSAMTTILTFEYLKKAMFSASESAKNKSEFLG